MKNNVIVDLHTFGALSDACGCYQLIIFTKKNQGSKSTFKSAPIEYPIVQNKIYAKKKLQQCSYPTS
jgi:hypothetical protein